MNSWALLQKLNYKQLLSLAVIFIKRPLYVYPVLKATSASMLIAQQEFPNIHGKNNQANAFRHGLWSGYIVLELVKWKINLKKAVQFATVITTWHEDFSPNKPLETTMDLHNNAVGVLMMEKLLLAGQKINVDGFKTLVHQKLNSSKQIFEITDAEQFIDEFVYLEA